MTPRRLIHGYDVVDSDVLWQTVVGDIPELLTHIDRIRIAQPSENDGDEGSGGAS